MRKGFTRKPQADAPATPVKNYITPSGLERLKDEHRFLLTRERPAVTEVVAWAASNGDRGEMRGREMRGREMRGQTGRSPFFDRHREMRGQTGRSPFFDRHRFARFPVNWGTSRLSPGSPVPRFPISLSS